jgi:hypothetical protein
VQKLRLNDSNELLDTIVDEANAVAINILHVHFPVAPALVGRWENDWDAFRDEFRMQEVDVFDDDENYTAGNPVARKRRNMELDFVTRQAHVARIWIRFVDSVRKRLFEAKAIIKLLSRN